MVIYFKLNECGGEEYRIGIGIWMDGWYIAHWNKRNKSLK
jgi:hypothetical protein